ncbi:Os12g0427800 [Oryza sativa Japonica Group]|uniref:Os12g0427800 protein n=1 Tax=Oryza sativa subsp. japonica TaxID=39947 RepID=A0A0P0Y9Y4_ORYSJ|nr:Os12g0427800 [Oryza sativa Japonica Group]
MRPLRRHSRRRHRRGPSLVTVIVIVAIAELHPSPLLLDHCRILDPAPPPPPPPGLEGRSGDEKRGRGERGAELPPPLLVTEAPLGLREGVMWPPSASLSVRP